MGIIFLGASRARDGKESEGRSLSPKNTTPCLLYINKEAVANRIKFTENALDGVVMFFGDERPVLAAPCFP
jgi:hypothetical protein